MIHSILGFEMEGTTYIRAPFYARVLKPLAWLPYRAAWAVFFLATLSSVLWFIVRFSKECPALPFFASMSIALLTPLMNGQDTPFLVAIVGVSILLFRRGRDFPAGLALSLCVLKPHLFIYVALLLLIRRRWRAIQGGGVGLAILALLSLGEIRPWINVLRDPQFQQWISPDPQNLPNLHGLILTLRLGAATELAIAGVIAIVFVIQAFRSHNFEFMVAVALVCGLLTSFHSGPADDVLLLPFFVLVIASSNDPAVRSLAALILTPIPYLLGLAGSPYSAVLPAMLIAWLVAAQVPDFKRRFLNKRTASFGVLRDSTQESAKST